MKWKLIVLLSLMTSGLFYPVAHAAPPNTSGMIYGEVTMRSGSTYRGVMRWGKEEFFWGDLFNSSKVSRPHREYDQTEKKERDFEVFGYRVSVHRDRSGRQFIVRFGDIERIEVTGKESGEIVLKSGSRIEVDGGSNDVGGRITVHDDAVGAIEVKWGDIDTIEFMNTPATATYNASRLYGTLTTSDRTFVGFIQWDKEECLSTDLLNGHSDDGKLNIPMGNIKRIERYSKRSCDVMMNDGRTFRLSGTNDVNHENRGIMVETKDYGRVVVKWDEFRSLEFSPVSKTGPTYSSYAQQRRLKGTVTGRNGQTAKGFIAYDLDEEENWEMLNGHLNGVEYIIPMGELQTVEPRNNWSKVPLRHGDILELEDTADVNQRNAGVLVIDDGEETYFEWDEIERIDFDI
jgi:hypothetical protein